MEIDPVCKMNLDPAKAAAKVVYAGQTHYFCSDACHMAFTNEPRRYTRSVPQGAERIVQRVFREYPGSLAVRLWNGEVLTFGAGTPDVTLVFRDPGLFRELVLSRDPLRLAEAYLQDRLDVDGNLYAALRLKDHLLREGSLPVHGAVPRCCARRRRPGDIGAAHSAVPAAVAQPFEGGELPGHSLPLRRLECLLPAVAR